MPQESADRQLTSGFHPYPLKSPRFWHGMPAFVLWKMLLRNGFRVSWRRWHILISLLFLTPFNELLALAQELRFGRKIRQTEPVEPPIFIIGHWRSGTTLLHELLAMDPRFAYPTTFQCFAPWHFLLSEWAFQRFGGFLLPSKRPMDNMRTSWSLPQEDEFALMNLGAPTTYERIAFPQSADEQLAMLDMDGLTDEQLDRWKKSLQWFVQVLSFKYNKPLILKSPPHTGRIEVLAQMFPGARFVHITRDPRSLYPSTVRLWRALEQIQALHLPATIEQEETYVQRCFQRMYGSFNEQRSKIPNQQFIELRYEDLVADPVGQVAEIYRHLSLPGFDQLKPLLEQRAETDRDYKTNKFQQSEAKEAEILAWCGDYATQYGYSN